MDETWRCSTPTRGRIIVRCVGVVTNHELRRFVGRQLGADFHGVTCETTDESPDVQVRWFGTDYDGVEGRRMQKRVQDTDPWRDV